MEWNNGNTKIPSEGQVIVIRERSNYKRKCTYCTGVWIGGRIQFPWMECPICGSHVRFSNGRSSILDGVIRQPEPWHWLPLSRLLQAEQSLAEVTDDRNKLYERALRSEELMYNAYHSSDYSEIERHVAQELNKL